MFREKCSLGSHLLDLGYSFGIHVPRSLAERQGIRHLLSRSDKSIKLPNIARVILQESEKELIDALNSGTASPNDRVDGTSSLIDYAFGWPKGIRILLEAGATPSAKNATLPYFEDNDIEGTYHSAKLLLEAGCSFHWYDIGQCQAPANSNKIKSLLINELVVRRKKLWHLAQSCLAADQLPKLISDDEKTGKITIFDIHTAEIHVRLKEQGISIDPNISDGYFIDDFGYESVYHFPYFTAETLDELYQVGFRGVTQLESDGFMPLLVVFATLERVDKRIDAKEHMKRIHWLVSKGADPYQKVRGTSATAAHHLGVQIVDNFLKTLSFYDLTGPNFRRAYETWKQAVVEFGKSVFLLPWVRDGCFCACSPGGCTTMSVLLRHIVHFLFTPKIKEPGFWVRELIQFFLWWTRGDTEIGWEVIRFLTFDALGLKHSCCIEKYPSFRLSFESREEEEIKEILDEEKSRMIELEKLLDELNFKFDELGLPVMEFLEEYWQTRMIEVLSHRDPYDEEHIIESRRIGVTLEPDECVVPDRVSLLIGSKILYEIST
ncbi:hypothetical protein HAV15_011884 [Penicillium sp. str. |nr:hypothetical protein HAV15_011884 [Penicillium sp. str. \